MAGRQPEPVCGVSSSVLPIAFLSIATWAAAGQQEGGAVPYSPGVGDDFPAWMLWGDTHQERACTSPIWYRPQTEGNTP